MRIVVVVVATFLALIFIASALRRTRRIPTEPRAAAKLPRDENRPRPFAETARTPSSAPSAPATAVRRSTADTIRRVHAKLHELGQRKTGDDETLAAILAELLPLIDDANAADLTRALSNEELRTPFGTAALTRWLQTDAGTAARWLGEHDALLPEQTWSIGQALVKTPDALDTMCAILPPGPTKQTLLNGAALTLADRDPQSAIALASRMDPGDLRTSAFETIAYAWAATDAGAAQKWASGIDDPMLRQRLLAVGAKALAVTDPDLAATWLSAAVRDGAVLNETALTIVDTWSEKNPAAAAAWVATFGNGTPRAEAIELVAKHWMKSDPAAANAWLLRQPERADVLAKLQAEENEAAEPKD